MNKVFDCTLICLSALLVSFSPLNAQVESTFLQQIFEEDRETINALVMYPKETRMDILKVASYPQVLIKLNRIQEKTSDQFKELLQNEDLEVQQMIWDLTRYPYLVQKLAFKGYKSEDALQQLLKEYPSIIHTRATEAVENYHDVLIEINNLDEVSDNALETLLSEHPEEVRNSVKALIELPEVLSILTENIELTILAADLYEKNPDWLIAQTDSLSEVVKQQNEEELKQWQENLDQNPTALEDLKNSSEEFYEEYGFDDLYYDDDEYGFDDLYYEDDWTYEDREEHVIVEHHSHHYPYWYGYPHWYGYPRWRHYPFWWDCGYYNLPNDVFVVVRFPSYFFLNWYFFNPHHHFHYPHLTNHFIHHSYYGPRYIGSIHGTINKWKKQNSSIITDEWLSDKNNRIQRIKEFGQLETSRQKHNAENPNEYFDQKRYLEKERKNYPNIVSKTPDKIDRRLPDSDKQKDVIEAPPSTKKIIRKPTMSKKTKIDRIYKAKDYHQQSWKKDTPKNDIPTKIIKREPTPRKVTDQKPSKAKIVKKKN